MAYVADIHLHSRFAYACSKDLNIPNMVLWAKIKGIDLLGTGDCLHPLWRAEFKRQLTELGNGLFIYDGVRFVLSTEVACIYSERGKQRRIHILLYFPDLETVEQLSEILVAKGINLKSDGRPILGLSVQELCQIVWDINHKILVIPAHIWTPWFGIYGSKSGYDFFLQCFGQFSDRIYAIETGLSSDPIMNWRVSELDHKSILSFSDAHSLPNIGREVTIFKGNLSYDELYDDIRTGNIIGTIEFYPEEGMYHYSGHRKCQIVYGPEELSTLGPICPVCHRPLTIGVMQRVEELATRTESELKVKRENGFVTSELLPERPPFQSLIGLEKIISDALGVGPKSKKVQSEYEKLTSQLGNEIFILTKASIEKIKAFSGERVAQGVQMVREGKVQIEPGFDGVYGKINLFNDE